MILAGCTGGGTTSSPETTSASSSHAASSLFEQDYADLLASLTAKGPPFDGSVNIILLNEPEGDFIHHLSDGWMTWNGRSWTKAHDVPSRFHIEYPAPWQHNVD